MGKNRNHYFKVKPGDEERMLRDVDVQAVGLLHRLRLVTFDCDPVGFAVDHKRRPLDLAKLADTFYMANGRFRAIFNELRERQLVQTAEDYRAAMLATPGGWVKLKIEVLHDLLRVFEVPLSEVYLVPTLVDEHIDTIVGQRTQKLKKNGSSEASMPPMHAPHGGGASAPPVLAQISEVIVKDQNQRPESSSSPSRERESSAARVRGDQDERPMTIRAYTARAHEIAVWQKRVGPLSPERFAADFEAEFEMSYTLWCQIRRDMERAIEDTTPQTCRDGHHIFDGDYCKYCPFIRVGETA